MSKACTRSEATPTVTSAVEVGVEEEEAGAMEGGEVLVVGGEVVAATAATATTSLRGPHATATRKWARPTRHASGEERSETRPRHGANRSPRSGVNHC